MGNNIVHSPKWEQRRNQIRAQEIQEIFDRQSEALEKHARHKKCCEFIETGTHPMDDWHLCLRTKGHKGFHMDKHTGFTWKWESDTSA